MKIILSLVAGLALSFGSMAQTADSTNLGGVSISPSMMNNSSGNYRHFINSVGGAGHFGAFAACQAPYWNLISGGCEQSTSNSTAIVSSHPHHGVGWWCFARDVDTPTWRVLTAYAICSDR
jgi:hypothetical protein